MERLDPLIYEELLRDTEAFEQFLTDDGFAREWLHRSEVTDVPRDYLVLGPIFTGVTPGTGS